MKYLTTKEIASVLKISTKIARIRCSEGKFENAFQDGGQWRVPEESLCKYIKDRQEETYRKPEVTYFDERELYKNYISSLRKGAIWWI